MSGLESAPGSCSFHYSLSQTAIFSWVSYKAYVSAGSIDNSSAHAFWLCATSVQSKNEKYQHDAIFLFPMKPMVFWWL